MAEIDHASTDEAADAPTRNLVHGVSQHDWNYWHSHPATRLLRKYLRDYAESLEAALLQRWREDKLQLATEHEIRNRLVQIAEIEKLRFDDVKRFYETESETT